MKAGKTSRLGLIVLSALVLIPFLPAISWAVDIGIAGAAKEVSKKLKQEFLDQLPEDEVPLAPGLIHTVAGTGTTGYNGDSIEATSALINYATSVAVDSLGNIYISDDWNHRIRKIDIKTGIITTVAGTGVGGWNGDNIEAIYAQLYFPAGIAFDGTGNLFISDSYNHIIRKVNAGTGIITHVAGTGSEGYSGDGSDPQEAALRRPKHIAFDKAGNLYIADSGNHCIRKVSSAIPKVITTVAGIGPTGGGYNGDGIPAIEAQLNEPIGVALDDSGNLYIGDRNNHRIRKVDVITGQIGTVVGTGAWGFNGDGIDATIAQIYSPHGVSFDNSGNLYIADRSNERIRRVEIGTGIINTAAGNGTQGYNGDGIEATSAELYYSYDVAIDISGGFYIADYMNQRIRRVGQ